MLAFAAPGRDTGLTSQRQREGGSPVAPLGISGAGFTVLLCVPKGQKGAHGRQCRWEKGWEQRVAASDASVPQGCASGIGSCAWMQQSRTHSTLLAPKRILFGFSFSLKQIVTYMWGVICVGMVVYIDMCVRVRMRTHIRLCVYIYIHIYYKEYLFCYEEWQKIKSVTKFVE